jgi:putative SOS response-associated peptidase YedK
MCGRYVSPDDASIEREFNLVRAEWQFPISYNVAPTQNVPAVRVMDGKPQGVLLRWGLIPFWAHGIPPTVEGTKRPLSTINAKVENIRSASAWRDPWMRGQRCIIPALGFYEWQVQDDGNTTRPFYIIANDQEVFGFAGLWDTSTRADSLIIESCTIVTVPANKLMRVIHNGKYRMPAILTREDRDVWLTGTPDDAFKAIKQYPDNMLATQVSTRVNAPKNNDAKLIEPA